MGEGGRFEDLAMNTSALCKLARVMRRYDAEVALNKHIHNDVDETTKLTLEKSVIVLIKQSSIAKIICFYFI